MPATTIARALLGLTLLAGAPAAAPVPAAAAGQEWRHPGIDCRCRANGRSYAMGERACLRTPAGFRLAECAMVQNVTSWTVLGEEGCVVSALPPAPGAG